MLKHLRISHVEKILRTECKEVCTSKRESTTFSRLQRRRKEVLFESSSSTWKAKTPKKVMEQESKKSNASGFESENNSFLPEQHHTLSWLSSSSLFSCLSCTLPFLIRRKEHFFSEFPSRQRRGKCMLCGRRDQKSSRSKLQQKGWMMMFLVDSKRALLLFAHRYFLFDDYDNFSLGKLQFNASCSRRSLNFILWFKNSTEVVTGRLGKLSKILVLLWKTCVCPDIESKAKVSVILQFEGET